MQFQTDRTVTFRVDSNLIVDHQIKNRLNIPQRSEVESPPDIRKIRQYIVRKVKETKEVHPKAYMVSVPQNRRLV